MTSIQDIQALRKVLGGMNYTAPSSYKPFVAPKVDIKYHPVKLPKYDFKASDFTSTANSSKKSSGSGINVWKMLSSTLNAADGFVTNAEYNALKHAMSKKESIPEKIMHLMPNAILGESIAQGIKGGAKKQMKDWTDGKWSWGDIPGVGFLDGTDDSLKRGHDIMDLTGMKNGFWKTAAGLGIDIVSDPLTYATGGLSMAGKLSKVAEGIEIANQAKKLGIVGKVKNVEELKTAAYDIFKNQYIEKYPNLAHKLASSKVGGIEKSIMNAKVAAIEKEVARARNDAFNSNINKWGVSVPFSKKMTGAIGDISEKSPLYRTEATLGSANSHVAENLIDKVSLHDQTYRSIVENAVKHHYGVSDLSELTKTHMADLAERMAPVVKQIEEGKFTGYHNDGKLMGTIQKMLKDKYTGMNNARTNFEHMLDRKNPFEARSLGVGKYLKDANGNHILDEAGNKIKQDPKYLNSMGHEIMDANSQRIGETAKYTKGLSKVQQFVKKNKLTPKDMREAIYHIEGKAPDKYGAGWVPSAKVQKLAGFIQQVTHAIGKDDVEAGNLTKMIANYFPHVLNKSDGDIKDLIKFDASHPSLKGLSNKNVFDNTRKSFKTIAEQDNYIEKVSKLIRSETYPAKKADLENQLKRVENLFDTNVVSALTRRVQEGVRSRAAKELQTKLQRFGMMDTEARKGLEKLSVSDAKKLGLKLKDEKGIPIVHYMNPKVLEGLKKTDSIFTNEGMKKWARHLSAIADVWRPLVTYYKPTHYINNLIGNGINNMAAGVRIRDYGMSKKLIMGWRNGTLTKAQMNIMHIAYKKNTISGGFLLDSMPSHNFKKPTWLENVAKVVGNNKVIHKVRTAGEFFDDFTRLANFVNGLDKYGGNADKAATQVREYLFNYNELSKADRTMRTFVPFWNWTKRNIPLQMKLLMENPKFIMNNVRFRDLFNYDDKEGADWQKNSGIKVNKDYYTTVPSPVNDVEMLGHPGQFLGSLNPALKMGAEMTANKKFYTGKPISYGSNSVQAKDVPQYLASNLGIGGNIYDLLSGRKTPTESAVNLFKTMTKINHVGK
jgi:hypothetical protein